MVAAARATPRRVLRRDLPYRHAFAEPAAGATTKHTLISPKPMFCCSRMPRKALLATQIQNAEVTAAK